MNDDTRPKILAQLRLVAHADAVGNQRLAAERSQTLLRMFLAAFVEQHGEQTLVQEWPGIVARLLDAAGGIEADGLGAPPASLFDEVR